VQVERNKAGGRVPEPRSHEDVGPLGGGEGMSPPQRNFFEFSGKKGKGKGTV